MEAPGSKLACAVSAFRDTFEYACTTRLYGTLRRPTAAKPPAVAIVTPPAPSAGKDGIAPRTQAGRAYGRRPHRSRGHRVADSDVGAVTGMAALQPWAPDAEQRVPRPTRVEAGWPRTRTAARCGNG
jgi:hypothetical protein